MTYKAKLNWKDLVEKRDHAGISRRDLLARGMATGFITAALPPALLSLIGGRAESAMLTCPPATRAAGAIAQIYAEGGPTMGARFIGEDQAALMNATVAANYGISGTNLLKLGSNLVIDTTSPFGATIMQGPPGWVGGSTDWQTKVLSKISGGGHRGPFNADDGAGSNTGLLGGVASFKNTQLGKDLQISVSNKMANWATGIAASSISRNSLTPAGLSTLFSVAPSANGLVTSQSMTDASNAAIDIAAALSNTFGHSTRNGATTLANSTGCALYGNSALVDPAFGSSLFTATGISALSALFTVSDLSTAEQALLASYYQSASGVIGGVVLQLGGRDYHGQNPQTVIAPADIEEARAIVMFLAACYAANAPGSFLYFSNGQAVASGVQAVTATIGNTTATINAPVARGDAGGSYNAGLVIFFNPAGPGPAALFTGTIAANSGNAKTATTIQSSQAAVSGLYLSALKWINGGTDPTAAATAMNIQNLADVMVL